MDRLRDRRLLLVRGILAWICAGHVITGLVALLSDAGGVQIGMLLYGASFEPTSQFLYIIRPLGVYILALAYLQAMAVWNPWRYRAVIDVTIAVFVARQVQRLIFAGDIMAAFGIPPDQHWLRSAYFLVLAVVLLLARLRLRPDLPTTPATPSGGQPGAVGLGPGVTR